MPSGRRGRGTGRRCSRKEDRSPGGGGVPRRVTHVVDEPVLELHVDDPERLARRWSLDGAITVGPEPPAHPVS